jgi:PAS domain S-box-containing protein
MQEPLKVLIAEDSQLSAEAANQALTQAGFSVQSRRVDTRQQFTSALNTEVWSVIISDYMMMPDFNGRDALEIYKRHGLDIPFICVSGEISGEEAAELVRAGAHDYLSKENLSKLGAVVQRELAFAEGRKQKRRAEELAEHLASIVEGSDDAILGKDLNGVVLSWNHGAQRIYGYTAREMVGASVSKLIPPDRLGEFFNILDRLRRGGRVERLETERLRKDGVRVNVSLTISPIRNSRGEVTGASTIARDITQRHRMETERDTLICELKDALSKVKMLSGLLPICSSCKRIRDEVGHWEQVEVYVHEHSQADFTHGICPECALRLYPTIAARKIASSNGT